MRSVPELMSKACDEINQLRAERDALNARISAMEESTHYANGCADLAMKHRDIAEAELAALRARIDGAPILHAQMMASGRVTLSGPLPADFAGKRVTLVPLDD